jgi:hypothetical protein
MSGRFWAHEKGLSRWCESGFDSDALTDHQLLVDAQLDLASQAFGQKPASD